MRSTPVCAQVIDDGPKVVHGLGHRLGETAQPAGEIAETAERRELFGPLAVKRQRVHQDVVAGPVIPRQREEPPVGQIRRPHEAVDDAQRGTRPVVMAPVLRAHDVVGRSRRSIACASRVDRREAAGKRDVVHRAARDPLCQRAGRPRRDPGRLGRRRKRLRRISLRAQLGVEVQVVALGAGLLWRRDVARTAGATVVVSSDDTHGAQGEIADGRAPRLPCADGGTTRSAGAIRRRRSVRPHPRRRREGPERVWADRSKCRAPRTSMLTGGARLPAATRAAPGRHAVIRFVYQPRLATAR